MLSSSLAGNGENYCRSIAERLLHIVHNVGYDIEILLGSYLAAVVLSAEDISGLLCKSALVKTFFIVATGICYLCIGHRQHVRRINAARKETFCNLAVFFNLREDVLNSGVYLVSPIFKRLALIWVELGVPVTGDLCLSVFMYKIMTGHQFLHTLEECVLACNICQGHVYLEHFLVELLNEALLLHYAADSCAVEQSAVCGFIIVKWLCAEMVTHAENLAVILNSESEHTVEMVCHSGAPLFVSLSYDSLFSVSAREIAVNAKFFAKLTPVADMTSVFF